MALKRPSNWNCGDCQWYEKVNDEPPAGYCYGSSSIQGQRVFVRSHYWCGSFTVRKGVRSTGKG